jgi:DnaJ family protein C protein 2
MSHRFYKFWYDFESWREYSYLDEEDKEKGSDREERRWIEKNNRVQRAERKKDEMKRLRKLVDNAYACDPRVQRFLEDDRRAKQEKKMAKQEAGRARREEEERVRKMEEDKQREEAARKEAEEKAKAEALKKDREEKKRALKKEKKTFRTLCKDKDFFATNDDERVSNMTELDKLCEVLTVEELEEINAKLEKAQGWWKDTSREMMASNLHC